MSCTLNIFAFLSCKISSESISWVSWFLSKAVAIGAPNNDVNGDNSGHAGVYKFTNGSLVQLGQDIDGKSAIDWSGFSVPISADGTIVAVGGTLIIMEVDVIGATFEFFSLFLRNWRTQDVLKNHARDDVIYSCLLHQFYFVNCKRYNR